MRVLVVGSGGREHALAWALAGEPAADEAVVRAGQSGHGDARRRTCRSAALDIAALVRFARENAVDLVVPGPEAPLVAGHRRCAGGGRDPLLRAERRRRRGWRAARASPRSSATRPASRPRAGSGSSDGGARRANSCAGAARRSWSRRTGWPPARAWWWPRPRRRRGRDRRVHGAAARSATPARSVVIEECLAGEEVSACSRCATAPMRCSWARRRTTSGWARAIPGRTPAAWAPISPPLGLASDSASRRWTAVIRPALAEMAARGHAVPRHPVRRADADRGRAQADRVQRPLRRPGMPGADAAAAHRPAARACSPPATASSARSTCAGATCASAAVVMAAEGYPGRGRTRGGDRGWIARRSCPTCWSSMPARRARAERLVAAGGRVLTVCGTGPTLTVARERAYAGVDAIGFPGGFCRRDIGARALARLAPLAAGSAA